MKKIAKRIYGMIMSVIASVTTTDRRRKIQTALKITKMILDVTSNKIVDFAAEMVLPDKIYMEKEALIKVLAQAIKSMNELTDDDVDNDRQAIADFVRNLSTFPPLVRSAISQKLASIILSFLEDNDLPENEYQSITDAFLHYNKYAA